MQPVTFFESLKQYVGFTDDSSAALRAFHPAAKPHFTAIVDDFYAAIVAHPGASASITEGEAQVARLKKTLIAWMELLLLGPHDEAYYERRARIGRMHVRIALPQAYMFTAVNRIRSQLVDLVDSEREMDGPGRSRITAALNQILDLELAIMLETYREDLVVKSRNAERLATIGQFAASIGHELRNPLGVIESSLFLLRQHLGAAANPPNVAKHLDRIGSEILRANKTIHDVLELARYRPPRREATNTRALVTEAAEAAQLPPSVPVDVSKLPEKLSIYVDPDQIRRVLVNLFSNAAQAMPSGGRIHIEGGAQPNGDTLLRIRDDGPGIPDDVRYRIFEALFTTKAKGSGLGLALCRRILEAHGGSIDLEPPAAGKKAGGEDAAPTGASFMMTLPAAGVPSGQEE